MLRPDWCRSCNGTGWVYLEDEADESCLACDGTGELDRTGLGGGAL
jgi:DnaJ-class molecular chaperone